MSIAAQADKRGTNAIISPSTTYQNAKLRPIAIYPSNRRHGVACWQLFFDATQSALKKPVNRELPIERQSHLQPAHRATVGRPEPLE